MTLPVGHQGRKLEPWGETRAGSGTFGGTRTHQAEGQGAEPLILPPSAAQPLVPGSRSLAIFRTASGNSRSQEEDIFSLQLLLHQIQLPEEKEGEKVTAVSPLD